MNLNWWGDIFYALLLCGYVKRMHAWVTASCGVCAAAALAVCSPFSYNAAHEQTQGSSARSSRKRAENRFIRAPTPSVAATSKI